MQSAAAGLQLLSTEAADQTFVAATGTSGHRSCGASTSAEVFSHSHRCVSTRASQAWRCAAAGHISSMAWAAEHWAARFASGLDWLQLVWRCERLCGARTGSPISTSFTACIHRGERGRLSGLPGDPGGHCRRPNRSVIDRASTVGDAVAPGWSRASLVDATVRC